MSTIAAANALISASDEERPGIARLAQFLEEQLATPACLVGADGASVAVSDAALRVLKAALGALAVDRSVVVMPAMTAVTTQQAADFLNVGHEYLIQLLDAGDLSSHGHGAERRVYAGDLLSYKVQRQVREREGLREITRLSEELGLYDDDFPKVVEE